MNLAKRFLVAVVFSLTLLPAHGQFACWVQFANKKGTLGTFANPSAYLSSHAIDRRTKQHIAIDSTDLPVSANYIQQVLLLGGKVKHVSKWLNGVTVLLTDTTSFLSGLRALPFVTRFQITLTPAGSSGVAAQRVSEMPSMINDVYGSANRQIDMHNGRQLHNAGFRGAGMMIGVIDAGFYKTDVITVFDSLHLQNRLLGTHDFADPATPFYSNTESHGTSVLSTMAANWPDQMRGTAPDASYWLIRTEYSPTEYVVETDNWVAGIEFADSVGVDVVNSSLGYTEFDNAKMNFTYAGMNGRTSRASMAATMAARKGMIVVCAAGNEGAHTWHYISSPADADSILAVGAIDYTSAHASFSGYGPTSDGRIKPDVCAVGVQSVIANTSNTITTGNGTSFASPIMAGLVACLWQSLPTFTNMQIVNLVKQYSTQYSLPDNTLGYGIPNIYAVYQNNLVATASAFDKFSKGVIYFSDGILHVDRTERVKSPALVLLYSQTGQKLGEWNIQNIPTTINLQHLPTGFYLLSITNSQSNEQYKLIKQ